MKARVRFTKQGVIKYIGHLDMMRYFQKAIKRANLPIVYSEGFNPHQIMTFGAPLGLGMTSVAEYMDIELSKKIPTNEAVAGLNDNMVDGIEVLSFKYLPDKTQNVMSATTAAYYKVKLNDKLYSRIKDIDDSSKLIAKFLEQNECIIVKKTKKSEKELNILPLIYEFEYKDNAFYIKCSSGSNDNIKPEVIIRAFLQFCGINMSDEPVELDRVNMLIERLDLYTGDKDNLISLDDIGIS